MANTFEQAPLVPCPKNLGIRSVVEKLKNDALEVFSSVCPNNLKITDILPLYKTNGFSCSWLLVYTDVVEENTMDLIEMYDLRVPENVCMVSKIFDYNCCLWYIEYRIQNCQCGVDVNIEELMNFDKLAVK